MPPGPLSGPGYHRTSSLLPSPHSHLYLCFCFSYAPLWCPGIHLPPMPCWAERNCEAIQEPIDLAQRIIFPTTLGHGNLMLRLFIPIQSFLIWAPPARCTSCVHPIPMDLSGGSVVTPSQGLTQVRTGHQSSFSGTIHTKASKCAPTTPWWSCSIGSCPAPGGQLAPVLWYSSSPTVHALRFSSLLRELGF